MELLRYKLWQVNVCALAVTFTPPAHSKKTDFAADSLTWLYQEEAIEQYMIEADILSMKNIGAGVTSPKVPDLAPGGSVDRISFKPIQPGR